RVVRIPVRRVANQKRRGRVGTVGEVDDMQALDIMSDAANGLLGLNHNVKKIAARIDDRCAGDADLRTDVAGIDVAAIGDAGDRAEGRGAERVVRVAGRVAGVQERALPEDGSAELTGVDGIEAIMLGGDENDVMNARASRFGVDSTGDGDSGINE